MKKNHSQIVAEISQFASSDEVRAEQATPIVVAALEWLAIYGFIDPVQVPGWPTNGLILEGEMHPSQRVVNG